MTIGGTKRMWRHAVVVGGGFAGLVTARTLVDHFERVTVLEQDELTPETGYRRGVPQARHPHVMLAQGAEVIEGMFDGLAGELTRAGAPGGDFGLTARLLLRTGWAPTGEIGIRIRGCTRAFLEQRLRLRVTALPGVTIRGGFRVDGLRLTEGGRRVAGVHGVSPSGEEAVDADLVVHTSGRFSALRRMLTEAGRDVPPDEIVPNGLSYSSRLFDAPPGAEAEWTMQGQYTHPPDGRRGGAVFAVESNRWLVVVVGAGGEPTPTDEHGFLEYARSLDHPAIAECVESGTPAGPLYRMTGLDNRLTPFHRMTDWPERLVALGDVVCTLNPLHGQGMTVAAMQSVELGRLLTKQARLTGLGRRFQRRAAKLVRAPWQIATSADLGWSGIDRGAGANLLGRYLGRVFLAIPHDIAVFRQFYRVAHLLDRPASLFTPRMLARVLLATGRRSPAGNEDRAGTQPGADRRTRAR